MGWVWIYLAEGLLGSVGRGVMSLGQFLGRIHNAGWDLMSIRGVVVYFLPGLSVIARGTIWAKQR